MNDTSDHTGDAAAASAGALRGIVTGSYFLWAASSAFASFAAIWILIITYPIGFLDGGYPIVLAKERLLDACDLGNLDIFGDSIIQSGFMPDRMPTKAANLAFGGGSPVETYVAVSQALACPRPPRRVVLSLTYESFTVISTFIWLDSIRYGVIGFDIQREMTEAADRLNDPTIANASSPDGFHGQIRDILYLLRFPPLYFANLVRGQLFRREGLNRAILDATLAGRGFRDFGKGPGSGLQASIRALAFAPVPVYDDFFNRTLSMLHDRGIATDFVIMPMTNENYRAIPPATLQHFVAYLERYEARYPNFRLVDNFAAWPDDTFADPIHLDLRGAEAFSDRLARCLSETTADVRNGTMQCDFTWRENDYSHNGE